VRVSGRAAERERHGRLRRIGWTAGLGVPAAHRGAGPAVVEPPEAIARAGARPLRAEAHPIATEPTRYRREPKGQPLARDDLIQATGSVDKILGGGRYQITLDSGQVVTAQLSGRMRRFRIRVIPGDRVTVGLSPYDPTHGFITFRLREGQDS
jgi:translation initiation factor IF-1